MNWNSKSSTHLPLLGLKGLFWAYLQSGGEHKDTAMKVTNSLINIRAITSHFQPRIEAWLASQQLSTPSEVSGICTRLDVYYVSSRVRMYLLVKCKYIVHCKRCQFVKTSQIHILPGNIYFTNWWFTSIEWCNMFCFLKAEILEVVRSNYDSLTLKIQESLDIYEVGSKLPT